MVSLCSGTTVQPPPSNPNAESGNKTKENPQDSNPKPTSNTGKKRKASAEPEIEGENASDKRPSTPPTAGFKSELEDEPNYERTPGRVGPIKRERRSVEPDIKPFKGPPGKKVRKTAWEKNEEYKQFAFENEGHTFHELYVCHRKGPNGSPTYDKSGFELDWHKVDDWMKPKAYNKSRMVNGMSRAVEKAKSDEQRMKEIFFEKGEAPEDGSTHYPAKDSWKDRVSKDLNIPYHKIGVKEFEIWEKKGFKKARRGEYEVFSEKEKARFLRLASGCVLRK